jgi:hypothetical protein
MFQLPRPGVLLVAICLVVLLLSTVLFYIKEIWTRKSDLFLFFNISLFLYVCFKYAFVRADTGHYATFFLASTYAVLFLFVFVNSPEIRTTMIKILPIVLIMASLVKVNPNHFAHDFVTVVKESLFYNASRESNFEEQLARVKLPQKIIDGIGSKTVDVMPTEISIVFFNKLQYQPRPVIQSYSAYSSMLQTKNYEKYLSVSAPDYVFYHTGDVIDNHFGVWDDQLAYFALLQRYQLADTVSIKDKRLILLRKEPVVRPLIKKLVLDTTMELNKTMKLPETSQMLFMECDLDYSAMGKIRRLIYQPSRVKIELTDESTTKSSFKAIVPLLNSGVLINKSLHLNNAEQEVDYDAMLHFFKNKGSGGRQIKDIKITASGLWTAKRFKVRFWEYSMQAGEIAVKQNK